MSKENGNELTMIACGKCGAQYRVHVPGMMRLGHASVSQALLYPTWSIEERICPNCKTMNAPVIGNVQIVWQVMEKAREQSRIIPAAAMPPLPPIPQKP